MTDKFRLIVDLSDGSTIVGLFIYIQHTRPLPQCFDTFIHEIPRSSWALSLRSDILGDLDIDARHIVRIGTDPTALTETKDPADVACYVNSLLQVAQTIPLNHLQPNP